MKIEDYIIPTQKRLQRKLARQFRPRAVNKPGNYLLVTGDAPILLVAHMDTVHSDPVKTICYSDNRHILMSPQGIGGDDRCGVYGICKVYEQAKIKPWLLFTCDEEIGCIGAGAFADDYQAGLIEPAIDRIKMIIEMDRKGKSDAVFYDCENPAFKKYICSKGFKEQVGSYSDIVEIGCALGIASVNLSSGYYNAHTLSEYIAVNDLERVIKKVSGIVAEVCKDSVPQYEDFAPYVWDQAEDNLIVLDSYLKPVPETYAQEYEELSFECSKNEIDEYREVYGDTVIHQLYDNYLDGHRWARFQDQDK